MIWTSRSADETRDVAQRIGTLLRPGDVVVLEGDLGVGKTTFVQGMAEGMGIDTQNRPVTSPTYQIMRHHSGSTPLFHYDIYRLQTGAEFIDIEGGDHMGGDGVVVIEWGDRVETYLPDDPIRVQIQHVDPESRTIQLLPGERSSQILSNLEKPSDPSV